MDVRVVFSEISQQLQSEFRKTAQVNHSGGKGTLREDAFARFLSDYLPTRYAIGRGEVVSPRNQISGQLDVVVYDPSHCPTLLKSSAHAVFPIESVFGVVSIKSTLSSTELHDAYENIATVKRLTDQRNFERSPSAGMSVGMAAPQTVGVVFAYQAGRSLEAIAEQAAKLDAELGNGIRLRPDFIVVLGEGIVGPRKQLRGEFNLFALPKQPQDLTAVRKTRRHTLLRAYLQILAEFDALALRNLDLRDYLKMPARVGSHLVERNQFVRFPTEGDVKDGVVTRISAVGIEKIVAHCQNVGPIPMKQHLLNSIGTIPIGVTPQYLATLVFEYNPRNLPPMDLSRMTVDSRDRPVLPDGHFHPLPFRIDGHGYAVDVGALEGDELEADLDMDVEELFSE
ncbi:MAG: DUF6602 domain-containing protein [Polyangiaceae bacterium]